jgi:hypothetical protein
MIGMLMLGDTLGGVAPYVYVAVNASGGAAIVLYSIEIICPYKWKF